MELKSILLREEVQEESGAGWTRIGTWPIPENSPVHNIFFSRFLRHFWSLRGRLREPHFRSIFRPKFCLFFIVILGSFWEPVGASDELALRAPRQLKIVVIFGSIFGAILE